MRSKEQRTTTTTTKLIAKRILYTLKILAGKQLQSNSMTDIFTRALQILTYLMFVIFL